jgi:hypothetical protein
VKASELSSSEREAVLQLARLQLGDSTYTSAVEQYGENVVLDATLRFAENPTEPLPRPPSRGRWEWVSDLLSNNFLWAVLGGLATAPVATLIVLAVLALLIWSQVARGVAIVVAVLAGVGLTGWGLWHGVPWLTFGVAQWFQWFSNHLSL